MGPSILNYLKYYHPTKNTNNDYMHSILYGVVKLLFKYWFDKSKKGPYSLRSKVKLIDAKLKRIRPPNFIPNHPRPIETTWHLWRCHEFLAFILYYALIVFKDLMPAAYFSHLINLVLSLEILLNVTVRRDALNTVKCLLKEFVKDISSLYDDLIMDSGVHELLHLVECSEQFGPLNVTSCFQFEELNRKIVQLIKGKDLIGEEFYKLFTIAQALSYFISQSKFQNAALNRFIEKHQVIKSSNKKKYAVQRIKVTCSIIFEKNLDITNLIDKFDGELIVNLAVINRCYYSNILFTDERNKSKFCDSFVRIKTTNKYGSIKKLIYIEKPKEKIYAIIQQYIYLNNCFFNPKFTDVKSRGFVCTITPIILVSYIEDIEKCFLFEISESLFYVNSFKMNHLFT
jgi:hypothetical protein